MSLFVNDQESVFNVLYNKAIGTNNIISVTRSYKTIFSGGNNPFASQEFKTPEVKNVVMDALQKFDFEIVNNAFYEYNSFVDLAHYLSNKFNIIKWTASIGNCSVTTELFVTIEFE